MSRIGVLNLFGEVPLYRWADCDFTKSDQMRRLGGHPNANFNTASIRVVGDARRLDRDLLRFRKASHWQAFLRLPPELLNAHPNARRDAEVQPDRVAVQAALKNFDAVAGKGQYRKIAQLRSFHSTHRLLREYVSLLSLPSAETLPPAPVSLDQRSILIPPTVEHPPEELRLADPQGTQ